MRAYSNVAIPYGAYWSTPFVRWQGKLANLHSIRLAARVAPDALKDRNIPVDVFDHAVLDTTVPQEKAFWGVPWFMSMIEAGSVTGPTISQACATSARCLGISADELDAGAASTSLVTTCDRTSNGPMLFYPNPEGPGGMGNIEHWVLDNFDNDPYADVAMVETAENVARDWQISIAEQQDVALQRYERYCDALANDAAFQRRYMTLPLEVTDQKFRKNVAVLEGDGGIHATTRKGLDRLRPVLPDGTVTYGGQTHPADGNAGIVVITQERAADLAIDPKISVRVSAIAQARERPAYMPAAPVLAAKRPLEAADIAIGRIDAIKSHNPFAVNDIVIARETGVDVTSMNNFGCSLIFGHPQAPTGLRLIIELIEELAKRGGGNGLFHGCAAGDTAMAVVLEVRPATTHQHPPQARTKPVNEQLRGQYP